MTLQTQLTALEMSGLVRLAQAEPDLEYLFKHALVQDSAYESLLKQDRRQIHASVARTLESLYADRLDEIYSVLAFHFNRAEVWDKTFTYAQFAADQAKQQYANAEALMAYDLALEASTKLETTQARQEQRFNLLSERQGVATRIGRFEQAKANLEEMAELARAMGDESRLADALNGLGFFYVNTGSGDPRPPLEEALAIKRRNGDQRGQADSLNNLGTLYASLGDVDKGMAVLAEARQLYEAINDRDGVARSEWVMGSLSYEILGDYSHAQQLLTRALNLCRENHNRALECGSLLMLGALHARTGSRSAAQTYLTQTLDLARQIGDRPAEGWAWVYMSWIERETGQLAESVAHAREAKKIAEDLGINNLLWYAHNALAALALIQRAIPEALAHAKQMRDIGELASVWTETRIRSAALYAYALTQAGQLAEGTTHAHTALQTLNAQNGQGVSESHVIYYYCYLALQAANDPAARPALQNAHTVVQAQAASITDPDWRAQLLNNIAINRDILHAWQQSSTP